LCNYRTVWQHHQPRKCSVQVEQLFQHCRYKLSASRHYDWGKIGHGVVLGPVISNFDMAIMRSFAVPGPSERNSLQFRAEFYNTLNTPQFSNPTTTVTSSAIGPTRQQASIHGLFNSD
jgi:hypothetical protein